MAGVGHRLLEATKMPWTGAALSGPHQSQERTPQAPPAARPGRPRGRIARGCRGHALVRPRHRPREALPRHAVALARLQGSIAPAEAESAGSSAVRRTKGSWPGTRWSGLRDRDGRARDVRPRNWASAKARRPAPSTFSSSSPSPRSIPVSPAGATYLGPGLLAQAMRDAEELALASYVLRGPRAPRRGPRPRRRAWFSTPSTWADEVRTSRRIVGRPAAVRPEEVTLARRLIAELKRADFRPEDFHDCCRARVEARRRRQGLGPETPCDPRAATLGQGGGSHGGRDAEPGPGLQHGPTRPGESPGTRRSATGHRERRGSGDARAKGP